MVVIPYAVSIIMSSYKMISSIDKEKNKQSYKYYMHCYLLLPPKKRHKMLYNFWLKSYGYHLRSES